MLLFFKVLTFGTPYPSKCVLNVGGENLLLANVLLRWRLRRSVEQCQFPMFMLDPSEGVLGFARKSFFQFALAFYSILANRFSVFGVYLVNRVSLIVQ